MSKTAENGEDIMATPYKGTIVCQGKETLGRKAQSTLRTAAAAAA